MARSARAHAAVRTYRWRAHDWSTECASGRPLLWPNRWVGRRTAAVARCQSKEARPRRSESPSPRPTRREVPSPPSSLPVHSITSSICVGTHRIPNNSIFTLVQRWNSPDMEPCDQSQSRVALIPSYSNVWIYSTCQSQNRRRRKTGADITSYLLNKDFIKVGPNENEAPPTFLWSVGKSDTKFPILICDLTTLSISGCSEQSD